jgi:hypothetical protein
VRDKTKEMWSLGNASASPGMGDHEYAEHGRARCGAQMASGPCASEKGGTWRLRGAALGARTVSSLLPRFGVQKRETNDGVC